jgi:hypothetical protein
MRIAEIGFSGLAIALAVAVCTGPSMVRAQEAESGEVTQAEPESKMVPTLYGGYGGDLEFQGNEMSAGILDVVQKGKNFSGVWLLGPNVMTTPTEVGPFKGKIVLTRKFKVMMTLQFPSDSFPHCEVKLSGASTDEGFSFNGTAREVKCGKDGKELGKGTFFLTAG